MYDTCCTGAVAKRIAIKGYSFESQIGSTSDVTDDVDDITGLIGLETDTAGFTTGYEKPVFFFRYTGVRNTG